MTETTHIDTTGLGLLLVAAVSLPLALGNLILDGDVSKYDTGAVAALLGLMIIAVAYLQYKANDTFGTTVFALVGAAVLCSGAPASYITLGAWGSIAFGIIFLFFIAWAVMIKGQKLLICLLITTALIFLLVGIMSIMATENSDTDAVQTLLGIVAFFNFIFNFWLGAGLVTEGKIPYY